MAEWVDAKAREAQWLAAEKPRCQVQILTARIKQKEITMSDAANSMYRLLQISAAQALIQEEVSKIAIEFGYPYPIVEKACQELCASRPVPANQTLAGLRRRSGNTELKQRFFAILQKQQGL